MHGISYESYEVVDSYTLLQIGFSWNEIQELDYEVAMKHILLHQAIKKKENDDIEKEKKKMKKK